MRLAVKTRVLALLGALALFGLSATASAQYRDEYGDIRQTVARISYITGSASFSRGDDPDNWQAADVNVPMTIGDRIYTGDRSRLELQIQGGEFVRVGARSDLAALNLSNDTKQFSVKAGVASFEIRRLESEEVFEVDTPNAAVTFDRPGEYRIDVDEDGNTRVRVRDGSASVAAGGGQVALRAGEEMEIDGLDAPRYDIGALSRADGWDRFVADREGRARNSRSYQYVSADVVGADDLDQYGRWEDVPQYGRCWTPASVDADWVPYRTGHWIWQDPWGWTWISAEPWGWAPYHYGRWVVYSSRWYWVPVAPAVRTIAYAPALVAFVGGGPGWSASVSFGGGGYVGWFPLGPRDPLVPWWTRRASANVNVTNITYVNRTYVTVVNQSAFASGSLVARSVVRDPVVVRQVVAAPVARGPIPVVPTVASLHVAARNDLPAAQRPPAQIVSRAVVARVAPPPAPPSFEAKAAVIRENRGLPVSAATAAQISVQDRGRPQAITAVRPVASESGRMTLSPRQENASSPRPQPVAPSRGRPLATAQQPVASAPVAAPEVPSRERAAPVAPAPVEERRVAPRSEVPARAVSPQQAAPVQPAPERSPLRENESWRSRERVNPVQPQAAPPAPTQQQPVPERGRERQNAAPAPTQPPRSNQPAAVPERGRERQNATPAPTQPPRSDQPVAVPERGRDRQNAAPNQPSQERPANVQRPPAQGEGRPVERAAPQAPNRERPAEGRGNEKGNEKKDQGKDNKNPEKQPTKSDNQTPDRSRPQ